HLIATDQKLLNYALILNLPFFQKTKCLNPPRTAKRVELYIKECQEDVKNKLIKEAYQILKDEGNDDEKLIEDDYGDESFDPHSYDYPDNHHDRLMRAKRRSYSHIYHPTLVPYEDKRIAGCLLHCVYAKNNAIDQMGWPTLDGLVDFYSEGVNEHGFFMATLRAVNQCLNVVTVKYHVNRRKLPEKGQSCDLAFDVFDCISDQITGYCLDHFRQA
ncbi:general odorant-binding protein 70, partial [Episyrphus balteatus]|uniref:general odorant-binding protein 70 n=1 Tax=Episyrphus balteatus TaxID=286459 RepID=UPI0024867273